MPTPNPILADRMASCALAAYQPRSTDALELLKSRNKGFMDAVSVFAFNTQAYVIEHRDFRAVAFRGTDEKGDWKDNLDLKPLEYWAHGFKRHAEVVTTRILDTLSNMNSTHGNKPLFITGHSLGGAAATIFGLTYKAEAHDFLYDTDKVKGIVTFGAPRCLTRKGVKWANVGDLIIRFRHHLDIVPRIPKGYKHPDCQLVYINAKDEICLNSKWWYRLQDRLSDFCVTHLVSDHDMAKYDEAIQKWNVRP